MPTTTGTKTNLFADDTMFMYSSMGKHHAATKTQKQLETTSIWLKNWRITINLTKMIAILFGDKKPTNVRSLKINRQEIKWSDSVKYFSINFLNILTKSAKKPTVFERPSTLC